MTDAAYATPIKRPPAHTPVVAVIGGGQLARMMAEPAAAMGIPLALLAEGPDVSAAQVIVNHQVGDYTDLADLRGITSGATVVTFDHEHVPTEHLRALAESVSVRPGPEALVYAQDKGLMRAKLAELGIPCPRNALVANVADLEEFGFPCVLKTTRGGYDGKGVWFVNTAADADAVISQAKQAGQQLLAEEVVDFTRELSILIARSPSEQVSLWPVVQTTQRDGICHEVIAPAPDLAGELSDQAQQIAMKIARALDVTGVMAVELFETPDGRMLVNELAMRPHNTGHWTQDGSDTSQFENHLRAILDLPLGSPSPRQPWTVMVNILGGVGELFPGYLHALARDPKLRVHLYGKQPRPGRKVGHVNAYGDDLEDCLERARHAAGWFAGELGEESE